jgi:hypothetical protein
MAHRRVTPLQGLLNFLVDLPPARCTGLSGSCTVGAQSQYSQNLMRRETDHFRSRGAPMLIGVTMVIVAKRQGIDCT